MNYAEERKMIALAAAAWLDRSGIAAESLPRWDVEALGWPDPALPLRVYRAVIPDYLQTVPMTQEALSRALRRAYDPDEVSPWVFVPSPDDTAVWLVLTKPMSSSQ